MSILHLFSIFNLWSYNLKWLIKNNNNPQCLHNRKNNQIFALRKVRNDINVIAMTWTKSREK